MQKTWINPWLGRSPGVRNGCPLFSILHWEIPWTEETGRLYERKVKVAQLYPTLCDPMDYIVHGILQVRILEWVAFPFSRGSSQPRTSKSLLNPFQHGVYHFLFVYHAPHPKLSFPSSPNDLHKLEFSGLVLISCDAFLNSHYWSPLPSWHTLLLGFLWLWTLQVFMPAL